jgi:preprotein translocase subunit SecA
MRTSISPRPGIALGLYPERHDPQPSWLERVTSRAAAAVTRRNQSRGAYFERITGLVGAHAPAMEHLGDGEIPELVKELRYGLVKEGLSDALAARSFALVREVAGRTLGMRHFDVQMIGGWVIFQGMLAEMETGEGKTLTATLPACTAALAGIPVHVITVNDYLAKRDAELMRPVYEALGLSVGAVVDGMQPEARRAAYACDVTYCTNKQIAFDYLKDRLALSRGSGRLKLELQRLDPNDKRLERLLLRGLCFAIVDEADSVLIDEARTPLKLSRPGDSADFKRTFDEGLSLASQLNAGNDYVVDARERRVELTDRGGQRLAELAEPLQGIWSGARRREELVRQALSAQYLFIRDRDYLLRDGQVQIIDESTGRVMPDRTWERGLHQMIQAKEGVEISARSETLARISYQRFFQRYLRLSGMSGTLREAAGELWSVYRLNAVTVPTHRPSGRRVAADTVHKTQKEKRRVILASVRERRQEGQPVLIGTRTVADSEHLSGLLESEGLPHRVLNARQDEQEAEIVERAGEIGRITVATNMAGRGTDIRLGPGVAERGGLHVIVTERHEAGRIDRQLMGRCARQGDPGSVEVVLSLEDELAALYVPRILRWAFGKTARQGRPLARWAGELPIRIAQRLLEGRHARMRRALQKLDERLDDVLAFTGRPE